MADRTQIKELLYRLCLGNDERDAVMLSNCFCEDATMGGITRAQVEEGYRLNPKVGRNEIMASYEEGWAKKTARRRHILTNVLLLEEGENEAKVSSYISLYLFRDETVSLNFIGRYVDKVVLDEGQWRIKERICYQDNPYKPGDITPRQAIAPR